MHYGETSIEQGFSAEVLFMGPLNASMDHPHLLEILLISEFLENCLGKIGSNVKQLACREASDRAHHFWGQVQMDASFHQIDISCIESDLTPEVMREETGTGGFSWRSRRPEQAA